ncbi:MAG: type II secretion system protein [Candidatus Vogelbacteria bacterium]|nr:type II secretion system protein [Candidatus Vogelbacteria bacterium]
MKLQATNYKLKALFGFSVLEVLIVLTIIVILVGVILWPYARFRDEKLLDGAAEDILSFLHEAQTRTLSSDGAMPYGVYFESGKMTLVPDNKEVILHNSLTISDISLAGGGATVMFKRLTGATGESGTVTVSLVLDNSRQRVIAVSPAGSIGLQ